MCRRNSDHDNEETGSLTVLRHGSTCCHEPSDDHAPDSMIARDEYGIKDKSVSEIKNTSDEINCVSRRGLSSILQRMAIGIIRFYQGAISPALGPHCRFQPTCSAFTLEAIEKYGFTKGCWLGIRRILKCGPWHRGGWDPVP